VARSSDDPICPICKTGAKLLDKPRRFYGATIVENTVHFFSRKPDGLARLALGGEPDEQPRSPEFSR
jgi:hypothetical protein